MKDLKEFLTPEEKEWMREMDDPNFIDTSHSHRTVSVFILNPEKTKTLMMYHLKFESFGWLGGHLEEGESFLEAAKREFVEESGIEAFKVGLHGSPIRVDKLWAKDHFHLNLTYVFWVSEQERPILAEKEAASIEWFPITEMPKRVKEAHMLPIYQNILERLTEIGAVE